MCQLCSYFFLRHRLSKLMGRGRSPNQPFCRECTWSVSIQRTAARNSSRVKTEGLALWPATRNSPTGVTAFSDLVVKTARRNSVSRLVFVSVLWCQSWSRWTKPSAASLEKNLSGSRAESNYCKQIFCSPVHNSQHDQYFVYVSYTLLRDFKFQKDADENPAIRVSA